LLINAFCFKSLGSESYYDMSTRLFPSCFHDKYLGDSSKFNV
jgi:hypothetical protein